jgi:pyrimidine-nucleoside phosphorylase
MRMYDMIHKKRLGQPLSTDEIRQMIDGYVAGEIPDYQMSAFTMAVCFQGMTDAELTSFTEEMANSGQRMSLAAIPGVKVDKHSTGGVGDTTTLVLAPWVAAVGVPVAKMSGRGLGHTGGTIDKLEAIPGFRTDLTMEAFIRQVQTIGIAVAAQTGDLAPADKKLYGLRDVTATVESIPLIASSIMSKKIASGADAIVLDVKVGEGAFMKDLNQARQLAEAMVRIGERSGRRTTAVLTRMDEPLGRAIGNALEVRESILTLQGKGPVDLTELCLTLGAQMVVAAGKAKDSEEASALLRDALADGRAIAKWKEFVAAQGGNAKVADDLSLLPTAPVVQVLRAEQAGAVRQIHAESMGLVAMRLGAGRSTREDQIDPSVGLVLECKTGDQVQVGDPLVTIHAASEQSVAQIWSDLQSCFVIGSTPAEAEGHIVLDVIEPSVGVSALDSDGELLAEAQQAREQAYVPYSKFAVGAAIRLSNGRVITGANVENASYGLTNCAERTAIFKFVTSADFKAGVQMESMAVIADSDGPVAPCGGCRQVLVEFGAPQMSVVLSDMKGNLHKTTVADLLPYAFDADQMRIK